MFHNFCPPTGRVSSNRTSGFLGYRWHFVVILLVWLLGPSAVILKGQGQQGYYQSVGTPTFLTSLPVENGNINAANGNLHLEIPLGSYPQRGKHQDKIMLVYDSAIWDDSSGAWVPNNILSSSYDDPTGGPWGGWRIMHTAGGGRVSFAESLTGFCTPDSGPQYDVLNNFVWTAPDGTQHAFAIQTINPISSCAGTDQPSGDAFASDATGYHMFVSNYANSASDVVVYGPDGSKVSPALEDTNGNYFSVDVDSFGNVMGDTLGRAPTITFSGTTIYYAVPNSQGGTSTYTLKTSYVNICSNFRVTIPEYCGSSGQAWLTELDQPDGTKYTFSYDTGTTAGHYGQLTSMTLPTGGQISYTYAIFTDAYGNGYPWISSRTTPDSTTPWTYTPTVNTSCTSTGQVNCQQQLTVAKPNGDNAVYLFTLNGGSWSTQVQSYTGAVSSANLLSTANQCYNFAAVTDGQCTYSPSSGPPATGVVASVTSTTLPMPGATTITQTTGYSYDGNSNMTQISGWNYYSGGLPAIPDRTNCITYVTDTNYLNANIVNLRSSETVVDNWSSTPCTTPPAAHIVAQTNYSYDGSALTSVTGVKNHDDTNYGSGNTVRGNVTQIQRLVSGSNYLTMSMTYDTTGQLHSSTDWSNANTTTFSYADNFFNDSGNTSSPTAYTPATPTNAYLTSATTPLSFATTLGYYFGTGQLANLTDPNGNTAHAHFYDSLNRFTAVSLPNGGWSLSQYNSTDTQVDTYFGISGNTTPASSCTSCRHDQTLLEGLGRATIQSLVSDPDGQTTTAITYDSIGRLATISNPYRGTSDPTYGIETASYDGLDRTIQSKHADNNIAYTYYGSSVGVGGGAASQNCSSSTYGVGYPVLVVDEVGNKRQSWADGFGRTIETDEPNSTGALTVGTCYAYDLNDNLTQVTSLGTIPTQTRSYTYDLLSRVTSTTTPESGTTSFSYTASGGGLCSGNPSAVCQRTDVRSIITTYAYDTLNRLTSISYNDTPRTASVTYSYDQTSYNGLTITNGKGLRTGMSDGSGQTAWSYDSRGGVLVEEKTINSQTKTISYARNLDESVASITYPSGRTVTYAPGNAQRTTSAIDSANSISYAQAATYAPQGGPSSIVHGYASGGFAGITESYTYNSRLQITAIQAASSAGTALNLAYSFVSGNNGNIGTQTNNVDTGRTQSYSYDNLSRILAAQAQATSGADCWGQTFGNGTTAGDDPLSNLLTIGVSKCTAPSLSVSVSNGSSATQNQITSPAGFSYDSAGNNTADALYTYTYDAENRIVSASGMTGGPYCYTYDGDGLRVEKSNGTSCSSASVDVMYWRTVTGDAIAETDSTGSTTNASYHEYVFFGGRRVARSDPSSGNVYYLFADQVGSIRAMTQANGSVCFSSDYYPYGQELNYSATCSTNYKFTGYERDSETGLDYALARYYNARLGRFMSGDPLGGDTGDPQTLNRYAYTENNPINFVDPLGLKRTPGLCRPDIGTGLLPCLTAPPPPPNLPDPQGGNNNNGTTQTTSPDNLVPANPCAYTGLALTAYDYASSGKSSSLFSHPINFALDVIKGFPTGDYLDAQPLASGNVLQNAAYGNYAFGVYMAAAHVPLSIALTGAAVFGLHHTYTSANGPRDPIFRNLPAANVTNITNGYNAEKGGTLCHE